MRGRSRPAFSPSIHQWETGDAGAPRLGRVVAAGGGREFDFLGPARGSDPFPPAGRAPTRGLQLASWALGRFTETAGRSQAPERASWAAASGMAAASVRPQPQLARCDRWLLSDAEAQGAGLGPEGACTRGVWIAP